MLSSNRTPALALALFLSLIIFTLCGCSGKNDPVSGNLKGTSFNATMPSHPVLSNVISITLDNNPVLGQGYSYGLIEPDTDYTFKADFAEPLVWKWYSDDVAISSPDEGTGRHSVMSFTAPSNEGEISISLDLSLDGLSPVTRRWRIHVDADPIPTEHIHPVYESLVKIGDPLEPVQTEIAANEFIVFFKPEISRETAIKTIVNMECTMLAEVPQMNAFRVYSFDVDVNTSEKMEAFNDLEYTIETHPNFIYFPTVIPNDPYWSEKWDLRIMDADLAWDIELGDDSHVLAIIDTGIDRDHPDLGAKVLDGLDFITPPGDGLGGETDGDGIDNNGDGAIDNNVGHGSHVAGISAAISNNGVGTTGVSWESKLIPLRIFPIDGDSGASWDVIAAAYNWLRDNAVSNNIIAANMSYGGFGSYSSQTQTVLSQCFNNGVILCAASGNANWNADQHYPSAYDDVLSVSATNSSDVKAGFSDYGTTVDVSAPGVGIRSTLYNNTYASWSGTSMACPQVTGLVGLVKARWPSYSQDEYVDQIKFTTDNIDAQNPSYVGLLGTGRINCYTAVSQGLTPNVEFIDLILDEDKIGWTDGNRDRTINSGEDVQVRLKVKNTGLTAANNVQGSLVVDNPMVHVVENSISITQINRGDTIVIDSAFEIVIDKFLADGTDVSFTFTLDDEDNNGPWEYNQVIKIYKNDLVDETLNVSGSSIGPDLLTKGMDDIEMIRIDFDATSNYVLVKNLTLTVVGTSPADAVDAIHIYLDKNGNGIYDGINLEEEIGISSYLNPTFYGDFDRLGDRHNDPDRQPIDEQFDHIFDNAHEATFEDLMISVTEDKTTTIFVTVDLNMSPCPEDTLGVGIVSALDIEVWDGDLVNGTFPIGAVEREVIPTWVDEERLTFGSTAYSWRVEPVVDDLGNVHVVLDENNGNTSNADFDIVYRRSTDMGETWGSETKLVDDNHRSYFPDIAATENGTLHVMFYDTPNGNDREILYMRSFDRGDSWETQRAITSGTGQARIPRMYAEGNILHAAFHADRDGSYDIYYFRSDDDGETFTTPVQVNNSSRDSEEVDLVALNGEVHISWQDATKDPYYNYYITSSRAMYAYSSNNGETFGGTQNMSSAVGGTYCYHTRLDIDASANVHVVFHSEGAGSFDVYMASGSGGTLSTAERVTLWNNSGTGMPDIIVDDDGRIELFYDDTFESVTNVWHQYREAGSIEWSDPVRLSLNFTGDAQIPNAVKGSDKNMYCFWQDYRNQTNREEVWFNRNIFGCN